MTKISIKQRIVIAVFNINVCGEEMKKINVLMA